MLVDMEVVTSQGSLKIGSKSEMQIPDLFSFLKFFGFSKWEVIKILGEPKIEIPSVYSYPVKIIGHKIKWLGITIKKQFFMEEELKEPQWLIDLRDNAEELMRSGNSKEKAHGKGQYEMIEELAKYVVGFNLLDSYFDSISDEQKPIIQKQLEQLKIY